MLFDTSSMLISVAKSDEDSQAEYLTMAKRIADLHKILVLAVVSLLLPPDFLFLIPFSLVE
jgi:archaellum biogenesis ATPase FlaH